jgi:membrane protein
LSISVAITTLLFALMYKFMPRATIAWRDVWIGAAVTAFLFAIGKFLLGLYLGKASVTSGFGAAGSLVILVLWVYYGAQIFLLGAEFTWVYSNTYGSKASQRTEIKPDGDRQFNGQN